MFLEYHTLSNVGCVDHVVGGNLLNVCAASMCVPVSRLSVTRLRCLPLLDIIKEFAGQYTKFPDAGPDYDMC